MDITHEFSGPNLGYVLELYERYRADPNSVEAATRAYFEHWTPPDGAETVTAPPAGSVGVGVSPAAPIEKIVGAANLARAIRAYGHLAARLDPLGTPPPGDPALDAATHGISLEDLRQLPASVIGRPITAEGTPDGRPADVGGRPPADALEAIEALRRIYCSTIGHDYEHIRLAEERAWLREAAESGQYATGHDPATARRLLERLTDVEAFEQFLQRVFPGKTRFSIEGVDMLVPMLDQVIGLAAEVSICTIFIGMAHRGRLNVLAHVLNKPYAQLLAEFRDPVGGHNFAIRDDLGWTGDVKYHKGAQRAVAEGADTVALLVCMPPNPSHLEYVDPVVEGMARAADSGMKERGAPELYDCAALPILIHGDASFSGQGVVAETLNMSRLPAYRTWGTIHIITNNQLGYTTLPREERSTLYASDLAKGFNIPVIHVNADDPSACLEAARIAFAYRDRFRKDFVIDLIGYRRYGHNEGDEPGFTQPLMYARIAEHPTVRAQWAGRLVKEGTVAASLPEELVRRRMDELQKVLESLAPEEQLIEPQLQPPIPGTARRVKTAVPAEKLLDLNRALAEAAQTITLNPKLERTIRRRALDDPNAREIDWGAAEELALASILADGIPIRLTGQDTERGTFNQRHAVYHDVENGKTITPLQMLPQARAAFEVANSPLSESAALGFEYGYNLQAPGRLVIWEAQYGDFINSGQAMVDEFVVSGRAKWEQTPSLVLLLPHGYEGQGPDHSSGRLERFLQSAAEINLRIAIPTSAAQYFHLLRRQAALLQSDPLPLVVMTPKSLLRNRAAASSLRDLAEGSWQPVVGDGTSGDAASGDETSRNRASGDETPGDAGAAGAGARAEQVRRLVLCSGKVYIDLIGSKRRAETPQVAILGVEQLFPFPEKEVREALARYPQLTEAVWVQEEPENMGAWTFVRPILRDLIAGRLPIHYIGRPPSSSPAEGSSTLHAVNQEAILELAFDLEEARPPRDIAWLKRM